MRWVQILFALAALFLIPIAGFPPTAERIGHLLGLLGMALLVRCAEADRRHVLTSYGYVSDKAAREIAPVVFERMRQSGEIERLLCCKHAGNGDRSTS